jgi:hypothetical protein
VTQATERAAGQRAGALSREHRNEHRHCWGEQRQCCRFFPGWDGIANDAVAILRAEAGRDPYDRRLSDLIGELSTRSEEFRVRWAAHNVKFHRTGAKNLHHPVVGELSLAYEALELPGDNGQRILVYTAEPGSPSEQSLKLLASWSATPQPTPVSLGESADGLANRGPDGSVPN